MLTLAWAAAVQAQGGEIGGLKFRDHGPIRLNVELMEPRRSGYGERNIHSDPRVESRMHYADKVFERLELRIRDDRLHEETVTTKNLRKRYWEIFMSQEERDFERNVREYWRLRHQLYNEWCGTNRIPFLSVSDPRLQELPFLRAEVERLGLGDMMAWQKREADEEAELFEWVRRDHEERRKHRMQFDLQRPDPWELKLPLPGILENIEAQYQSSP